MISQTDASKADVKGGYVGERMCEVYGNYFGNKRVLEAFFNGFEELSRKIDYKITQKNLRVLDIGANNGILGEYVAKRLRQRGFDIELTISDCNPEGLNDNHHESTKKIVADNKSLPFSNGSFDLVLARSVLQYEKSPNDVYKVIEETRRVLTDKGMFACQAATLKTQEESDILRKIHLLVNKPMTIQTGEQVENEFRKAYSRGGATPLPFMEADSSGFVKRYNLESRKEEITKMVQKIISKVDQSKRPNILLEKDKFGWYVPFTLFIGTNQELYPLLGAGWFDQATSKDL